MGIEELEGLEGLEGDREARPREGVALENGKNDRK